MSAQRAIIVGAGLVGPLSACMLRQRGWRVDLYERRGDPRAAGYAGGRSINLALSHRGIRALEAVGIADTVLADAIPMRARCVHDAVGATSMQPYSHKASRFINSVSRGGLNCALLDAAEAAGATMHFDVDVDSIKTHEGLITLPDGARHEADLLLGADGAGSAVRHALVESGTGTAVKEMLEHGYKELRIPAGDNGTWLLEREVLHIWPRGSSMMIALPNPDGSFTCTLFWALKGEGVSFERGSADLVRREYPDVAACMPTLDDDWAVNPVGQLGTLRCSQWTDGRTLLIGDAAHAIVPFYGQGMNAGFEDVRLLGEALDRGVNIADFAASRKPDTDAIADLALHNFIEMRDHTASSLHAVRLRVSQWLDSDQPSVFTPLYVLVTFSDMPYSQVLRVKRSRTLVPALFILIVAILVISALWLLLGLILWILP